jgi:predicted ATP-grasp superfamily ATP-dependent carboligase
LPHDLLILGASARAAAFSALRCGLHPICADFFADRDLAAVCRVERIDPHHAGRQFVKLAESLPRLPWFYTGGLENHPRCVSQIARRHALWGIAGESLRAVRDPARVAQVLAQFDIPRPAVRSAPRGLPRDASWLKKPLASGGGRGIEPLLAHNDVDSPSHYFQERIGGSSYSALFIGHRARARLIGITRQLIGVDGSPFAYRGSFGPLPIDASLAARLNSLGDALAAGFELAGWFGVDYVLRDGIPWPVEINPRYTASVEIYELASGRSLLAEHEHACAGSATAIDTPDRNEFSRPRVVAKSIVYAPRRLVVPELVPDENDNGDVFGLRLIADVPWPGTCFNPGEPVMSLLAAGADQSECVSRMVRLEQVWSERLGIVGDLVGVGERSSFSALRGNEDVLDD